MKRFIPVKIGDVDVLVETVQSQGSEYTSRPDGPVNDLFERAQAVIEQVARSAVNAREQLMASSRAPDQVDIQFGLKFSAKGDIIVAGASTDASLEVKITYQSPSTE